MSGGVIVMIVAGAVLPEHDAQMTLLSSEPEWFIAEETTEPPWCPVQTRWSKSPSLHEDP